MNENGPENETSSTSALEQETRLRTSQWLSESLIQETPPRSVTRENIDRFLRLHGATPYSGVVAFDSEPIELIGVTGINMSQVFFGFGQKSGTPLAVRTVHEIWSADKRIQQRFEREMRFLTQRENDVPQYWPRLHEAKSFPHPRRPNKQTVLLELIDMLPGITLEKLMMLRPEITSHPEFVITVALQLLHAIELYEEEGWVNRDLKTANVMIVQPSANDVFVKLFDASVMHEPHSTITSPGLVAGTPEYMSPEQARGYPLDSRSDVYAVGVVAYELLNNRFPFRGYNRMHIMLRHINDPLPPMESTIPNALQASVKWLLAKNKTDRPTVQDARMTFSRYYKTAFPDGMLARYCAPALI